MNAKEIAEEKISYKSTPFNKRTQKLAQAYLDLLAKQEPTATAIALKDCPTIEEAINEAVRRERGRCAGVVEQYGFNIPETSYLGELIKTIVKDLRTND